MWKVVQNKDKGPGSHMSLPWGTPSTHLLPLCIRDSCRFHLGTLLFLALGESHALCPSAGFLSGQAGGGITGSPDTSPLPQPLFGGEFR